MNKLEVDIRKEIAESIRNAIPEKDEFILWQHEAVVKWMNVAADIAEGSICGYGYDELKDFDMGYKGGSGKTNITPFRGRLR